MEIKSYALDYDVHDLSGSLLVHADCFEWLAHLPENSLWGVVTDPPFAVRDFDADQLEKREAGSGGVWRIPPSFDGANRQPLPRFTDLSLAELLTLREFFTKWSFFLKRALRPGGHVLVACNAVLSQEVFGAISLGGLEYRGDIIRLVRTFRGGDRPKGAELEFKEVCTMPRSCFEPWGLFRKPLPPHMTVANCLRTWGTGALRRKLDRNPVEDVIESGRTPQRERVFSVHPSLKPQAFLRQVVRAILPTGEGVIADPFMGSGSTVAAAISEGIQCVGIEQNRSFYEDACQAVPLLAFVQQPGVKPTV